MALTAPQLLIAALTASAAGAGFSAIQAKRTGTFQRRVAERNAEVAEQNASLELKRGEANADRIERQRRLARASTRAGFGASGTDPNTGSALAVSIDQAIESELDVQTALFGGKIGERDQLFEAGTQRAKGSAATKAAQGAVFGSVLSGVGTVAGGIAEGKNSGIFE